MQTYSTKSRIPEPASTLLLFLIPEFFRVYLPRERVSTLQGSHVLIPLRKFNTSTIIYNQSDFIIDHMVLSMCRVVSGHQKTVFAMTRVFSWQNFVSLCPDSFLLQGQTCLLLQVSLIPYDEKNIFLSFFSFKVLLQLFPKWPHAETNKHHLFLSGYTILLM